MPDHQRYLHEASKLGSRRLSYVHWALTNPLRSYTGGKAFEACADHRPPAIWADDMADQDVLIMGSGPSLDRVDEDFFGRFSAAIQVNFAIRRNALASKAYFFTTDLGSVAGRFFRRREI